MTTGLLYDPYLKMVVKTPLLLCSCYMAFEDDGLVYVVQR